MTATKATILYIYGSRALYPVEHDAFVNGCGTFERWFLYNDLVEGRLVFPIKKTVDILDSWMMATAMLVELRRGRTNFGSMMT